MSIGELAGKSELIYENPLASEADIRDFVLEGEAAVTFPQGRMRLENKLSAEEGQKANYVVPGGIPVRCDDHMGFLSDKGAGIVHDVFCGTGKEWEGAV